MIIAHILLGFLGIIFVNLLMNLLVFTTSNMKFTSWSKFYRRVYICTLGFGIYPIIIMIVGALLIVVIHEMYCAFMELWK